MRSHRISPVGVTPQLLRKLADVAENTGQKALKITGATRIAIIGLKERIFDAVWIDLECPPGCGWLCVRSIRHARDHLLQTRKTGRFRSRIGTR